MSTEDSDAHKDAFDDVPSLDSVDALDSSVLYSADTDDLVDIGVTASFSRPGPYVFGKALPPLAPAKTDDTDTADTDVSDKVDSIAKSIGDMATSFSKFASMTRSAWEATSEAASEAASAVREAEVHETDKDTDTEETKMTDIPVFNAVRAGKMTSALRICHSKKYAPEIQELYPLTHTISYSEAPGSEKINHSLRTNTYSRHPVSPARRPKGLREVKGFFSVIGANQTILSHIRDDRLALHGYPSRAAIMSLSSNEFRPYAKTAFAYAAITGSLFGHAYGPETIPEVTNATIDWGNSDGSWMSVLIDILGDSNPDRPASTSEAEVLGMVSEKEFPAESIAEVGQIATRSTKATAAAIWTMVDTGLSADAIKTKISEVGVPDNIYGADTFSFERAISAVETLSTGREEKKKEEEEASEESAVPFAVTDSTWSSELPPIEFKKMGRTKYVERPNGDKYFARKMPVSSSTSPRTDVEFVRKMYELEMPALLYGDPGTGKTALAEVSLPNLVTINGTGDTETADFIGSWTPSGPDEFVWINGPLIEAMTNGWPMLIDEIALIDPRVMSVVYGVMDGRGSIHVTANPAIGTVTAKPGFYVIGACNPNVPGAVMSDALLSRFSVQLEVTTDYSRLTDFGIQRDTSLAAKNLSKKLKSNEIMRAPQLRELFNFEKLRSSLGVDLAVANMISSADENDREVYESVLSSVFSIKTSRMVI